MARKTESRLVSNPVLKALAGHRSIRKYDSRPLPDDLLADLIRCGQRASTSSNLQATSVIHVTNVDTKEQLTRLSADQNQIRTSAAFLVFCADLHRDWLAWQQHSGERFDGDYAEALLIATVDAALFMQNVAVAAEAEGLGICMIGAIRNHPREVGGLLGLPRYVYAVSGFCIGWPDDTPSEKPRLPLDAVFYKDRYPSDEALLSEMEAYDQTMIDFYTTQEMHSKDPRWTTVMSQRTGRFHQRPLEPFLREQGFGWRDDVEEGTDP